MRRCPSVPTGCVQVCAASDIVAGDGGAGPEKSRLQNILMQLRKVCAHPYLFEGVEDRALDPLALGSHPITNCAKLMLLDKLLPMLRRPRLLPQMTRLCDILENYCNIHSYQYCHIDGSTSYEDREDAIDGFNTDGSSKFLCLLLSTRAGWLGINLAGAADVIMYWYDIRK